MKPPVSTLNGYWLVNRYRRLSAIGEASPSWDQFRHFHKHARIIALWQRLFEPLLRWLKPGRRRWLLALGAIPVALMHPIAMVRHSSEHFGYVPEPADVLLVIVILVAYVLCCYRAAQNFASLPDFVRRRPLVSLHGAFWALLMVLWTIRRADPRLATMLAGCALAMPFLMWRLSYLLLTAQRCKMAGTGLRDHAIYIWPVWGGTDTPFGKGLDYLKSTEAQDEEALARSQLAGLKLFVLALLCSVGDKLIDGLVFGSHNFYRQVLGDATLGIPTVSAMLAQPGAHPIWSRWVAIYSDLFQQVLSLGAYGHVVVGYLRLCGFNVFRNTYKPLLAETIVEFWNRYYYYFKELLVNFFFLPAFIRYFRRSPRMRLFTAVFASAFFGNVYYHMIQHDSLVYGGWSALAKQLVPRISYCFLLALGIYLSMLREQRRPGARRARPWPRRALAVFGVWTFFAVIRLWKPVEATFDARLKYLLGLAGVA